MTEYNKPYIIIGGTFDPVHNGHILLAEALYKLLGQDVVFTPTATPNYKAPPKTTVQQRLDMLKLAINNNPHFIIDSHEIYAAEYIPTIKSLQMLRERIGYTRPIYFLIGEDSLVSLDTWDDWQNLFNLANFIVAMRPGYKLEQMSNSLTQEYNKRLIKCSTAFNKPNGQIFILDFDPLDISSTKIRNYVAQGLPIDTMVSKKVLQYIRDNKLYFNNKVC